MGCPWGFCGRWPMHRRRRVWRGRNRWLRPMEEKKSFRWLPGLRDCVAVAKQMPQTRLLLVADREADLFELLAEAEATRKRVGVLVRAEHNRRLEGQEQKLWETLPASPH